MALYTKEGRPLQEHGDFIYTQRGEIIGRVRDDRLFGPDGRYVGTIVGDRLVYRSTDSARVGSSFSTANRAGIGKAHAAASAIWGDEPEIPN